MAVATGENEAYKFLKILAEFWEEDASIIGGGEIGGVTGGAAWIEGKVKVYDPISSSSLWFTSNKQSVFRTVLNRVFRI